LPESAAIFNAVCGRRGWECRIRNFKLCGA